MSYSAAVWRQKGAIDMAVTKQLQYSLSRKSPQGYFCIFVRDWWALASNFEKKDNESNIIVSGHRTADPNDSAHKTTACEKVKQTDMRVVVDWQFSTWNEIGTSRERKRSFCILRKGNAWNRYNRLGHCHPVKRFIEPILSLKQRTAFGIVKTAIKRRWAQKVRRYGTDMKSARDQMSMSVPYHTLLENTYIFGAITELMDGIGQRRGVKHLLWIGNVESLISSRRGFSQQPS